jgi:RimJ/RimL family protein N-acetyltransferase
MAAGSLELRSFGEGDFAQLIAQVPDAPFLLQWSGPEWTFPLDFRQLRELQAKTRGRAPSFKVYKAVAPVTGRTVGHIQLMDIDYRTGSCVLGRVLIFLEERGKGLGEPLVRAVLDQAFAELGLNQISLLVFAFNQPAVRTYARVGFTRSSPDPLPHEMDGQSLEVRAMELSSDHWLALARATERPAQP